MPENFPQLKVALLECGWVPCWMDRMDEEWEKRQCGSAAFEKETVTSGNWYYATEPEESTLPYVMENVGDDVILFASDYRIGTAVFPT